jgi:hypothetical protein
VVLQDRGERGRVNIPKVNSAGDPFTALDRAVDYLASVLRRTQRRDQATAGAWCWAVIHLLDAAAAAAIRRDQPDPWFADRRNQVLNPAGWAPLEPLTRTVTILQLAPPPEDSP